MDAPSSFGGKTLLIAFVLCLAVFAQRAQQDTDSQVTPPRSLASTSIPDFTLATILPSIVLANGITLATSTIIVSSIDGFTGTVTLSELPVPAGLTCTSIEPATIPNSSGEARVSCTSGVAKTYNITIIGTSGRIRHNATATFTFTLSTPPDFRIEAANSVSLISDTTVTLNVTVTPQDGFNSEVSLTATVYPSVGLSVSLTPQHLVLGSGTVTASLSASAPGDYTVTIRGTSQLLSHTATIVILVTLAGMPDFEISASPNSMNLQAGNPNMTRIIVNPDNGFAGTVTLVVATSSGISCSLSPISIESSGTSILTCNSSTPGDYAITIKAAGGDSLHATTVKVHVTAVSPASPVPSKILGLAPAIFLGIIAGIIAVAVAGTVLLLSPRGSRARWAFRDDYFFQVHIF